MIVSFVILFIAPLDLDKKYIHKIKINQKGDKITMSMN